MASSSPCHLLIVRVPFSGLVSLFGNLASHKEKKEKTKKTPLGYQMEVSGPFLGGAAAVTVTAAKDIAGVGVLGLGTLNPKP